MLYIWELSTKGVNNILYYEMYEAKKQGWLLFFDE